MRNTYKDRSYFDRQAEEFAEDKAIAMKSIAEPNISERGKQFVLQQIFEAQINEFLWLYNTGHPIKQTVDVLNEA